MMTNTNTDATEAALLACADALLEGALHKLVGCPATVSIGSDRYAGIVTKATRCTLSVEWNHGTVTVFRKVGESWKNRHYFLHVGEARTEMNPSF